MLQIYKDRLVGEAPRFPREIEDGIDAYLALQAVPEAIRVERQSGFTTANDCF